MSRRGRAPRGVELVIPGKKRTLRVEHVVIDFNGTLAVEGRLVRGVASRLKALASETDVVVMTADTFGSVRQALSGLPVSIRVVRTGAEKRRYVESLGGETVAAIGNGTNDAPMLRAAAVGIALLGDEGTSSEAIRAASVVAHSVTVALDLLLRPRRLTATLRR